MTAPIDLYTLLERCAALESEALSRLDPGIQAQAFPYVAISNDVYPFFTNSLPPLEIEGESQDIDKYTLRVPARLLVGHVNGGAKGEYERRLYEFIPQLVHYFNERDQLQSDAYESRADGVEYARIVSVTGLTRFSQSGTGIDDGQMGAAFTIEIVLYNPICQQYL